jgi:hypothetical protein
MTTSSSAHAAESFGWMTRTSGMKQKKANLCALGAQVAERNKKEADG